MEKNNIMIFSLVAIVAIVGMVVFGLKVQDEQVELILPENFIGQAAGGIKNPKADKPVNEPGSVWGAVKDLNVQGEHFNLLIHGKNADNFNCPAPQYDEYGNQVYGHVVNVPLYGENIRIVMESGSAKGRKAATFSENLEVTDWCAGTLGNVNEGEAVIRIPPREKGYYVFAAPRGTSKDSPSATIVPDLISVEVNESDLLLLGLVTSNGFETPSASFTRTKGKIKAVDITGMFEWSGDVCYLSNDPIYCYVDSASVCEATLVCCYDNDLDGFYDTCTDNSLGEDACLDGTNVTAYCRYWEQEWVFNIGDLVRYLWGSDWDGIRNFQVRFYPVP